MTIPTIDTFERDIVDEIQHKEVSVSEITTAVENIGGVKKEKEVSNETKSSSMLTGVVVILILCGLVGLGYIGYVYFVNPQDALAPKQQRDLTTQKEKAHPKIAVATLSPALNNAIGPFLTSVEKTNNGYIVEINSYSPVFSYMIKNESEFADELGLTLGNTHEIKKVDVSSSTIVTTTAVASTSQATTTIGATTTATVNENQISTEYIFSDITISNQNMRIAKSIYGTVVYAFVGTRTLVISTSPEGILTLRNNILHK